MDSNKYHIVVTEWLYPTDSGREVIADFDSKDEALTRCFELCDDELDLFSRECGDYLAPSHYMDDDGSEGVIINAKNGPAEWHFMAKIVEVKAG